MGKMKGTGKEWHAGSDKSRKGGSREESQYPELKEQWASPGLEWELRVEDTGLHSIDFLDYGKKKKKSCR